MSKKKMTGNNKSTRASLVAVYACEDCIPARGKRYPDGKARGHLLGLNRSSIIEMNFHIDNLLGL